MKAAGLRLTRVKRGTMLHIRAAGGEQDGGHE
jgi:hypothetical protein